MSNIMKKINKQELFCLSSGAASWTSMGGRMIESNRNGDIIGVNNFKNFSCEVNQKLLTPCSVGSSHMDGLDLLDGREEQR